MTDQDFLLDHDLAAPKALQDYLNPLPRSVVRSNEYELLDGEWRFALDLADQGLREHWYLEHAFDALAQWPGTIEAQMAAAQEAQHHTPTWQDTVIAWYERDFAVPDRWCNEPTCSVQVTFGACAYETRAWLNGHLLKTVEGEEVHVGAFSSFSYELPPEYLLPSNQLTVRIAHSLDADIPRGKQESRVYKRGGIWYQTISGPVRSVWLEPIERNRLRSRVEVLSQIEDGVVEVALTTRVHDPGIYALRLVVTPQDSNKPIAVSNFKLPLVAGERRQRVAVPLPNAQLWSHENPYLYQLVAQLTGPDGNISQITSHFGLRNVEARDHAVYLNNVPVYLDGILYQPANATFDEMRTHLLAMRELGCNLVRVHIAGIDPRIYDLADELGILLWVEVPSPHSSSARSRENHWAELQRMLVMIGAHPSVIIWSLYNEDWGAQDIATSQATREYIAQTFDWMQLHVPQVLVVDNDGWHHVSVEGRLATNLLTAHLYTTDEARWNELLDRLEAGDLRGVAAEPLVVGDPFFFRGQLPLVVSEWGGFGFPMYGGPAESTERTERIRTFKKALRKRHIAGDIYTQATSIEQEVNGLIDAKTGKLLVPAGLLDSRGAEQEVEAKMVS